MNRSDRYAALAGIVLFLAPAAYALGQYALSCTATVVRIIPVFDVIFRGGFQ